MKLLCYKIFTTLFISGLVFSSQVNAAVKVYDNSPMPTSLRVNATVEACENSPGPYITMGGDITLSGLNGNLRFSNNPKGTHVHEEDVQVSLELLKNGETIKFNKQPSRGGVGGNPWIYVQFMQDDGTTLSDEILLGRCVQGLDSAALSFALASAANLTIAGGSCSNHPGTDMTLKGEMKLAGINAKLTFRNNEKGTHEYSEDDVTFDLVILPAGESISFDKRPPEGGAGGNPHVYFQFSNGNKTLLGSEVYLGRCNKI